MELTGKAVAVDFGMAKATLHFDSETSLQFRITEKDGQQTDIRETVQPSIRQLRPELFLLSWKEESGTIVTQVHDYEQGKIHSVWSKPGGVHSQVTGTLKVQTDPL